MAQPVKLSLRHMSAKCTATHAGLRRARRSAAGASARESRLSGFFVPDYIVIEGLLAAYSNSCSVLNFSNVSSDQRTGHCPVFCCCGGWWWMQGGGIDGDNQAAGTVVRVGPVQQLAFVEGVEALPEYDGHHICVYLTDEGDGQGNASNVCSLGRRFRLAPALECSVFE